MNARILLVEDETIAADLLRELLNSLGHTVCGVTPYGEEALLMTPELKPDLILMDINLKGTMSGLVAAEKIQDLHNTPVIYLTAFSDNETIEQARSTRPYGYIQKPYRLSELRSSIDIALFRHDMEQRLKEREESYRDLADHIPGILYQEAIPDGKVNFFNTMLMTMTGYQPEDLLSDGITCLTHMVHPDDISIFRSRTNKALSANGPFEAEYRILHKNGEIKHVIDYGRPVPGPDGTAARIDGMIFDVTGRKLVEDELNQTWQKLEEKKAFYESIIFNNESGILVTDLNMRILLANPYVQRLCGIDGERLLGRHMNELFPEIMSRIAAGIDSDETLMLFGGQELTVGYSRFNLKGANRMVAGHIINLKDLSEIIRIRQEMRQKERLSTMGEVVARVAHEMRNPLFGMTAVGQILDMELQLSPAHKELIDSFLKEARRLNNLVEELLDCTKELRLHKKKTNLVKIIETSLTANLALAREKQVQIEKSFPNQRVGIFADPEKIEQVILNLLQNALQASSPGESVRIEVEQDSQHACVRIRDEGIGIPEHLVEKIFDVFYTTKKNGTGMGLSISRNIVEAHGGILTARNNTVNGATFTMMLPLERLLGESATDRRR